MKLKIGIVQFCPIPRQIKKNLDICSSLISGLPKLDILVFPEMCFTGYVFENKSDILPFAKDSSSLEWAKTQAMKLKCYVAYGTPQESDSKLYNSLYLVNPKGELQFVHQKSHLYELDEPWSEEGSGFYSTKINIREKELICSFGICMDLNPYQFKAPYEKFECSTAAKIHKSDIMICSNAWLHPDQNESGFDKNMDTIYYWVDRLSPLIGTNAACIIANRTGTEIHYQGKTKFAGSSAILHFQQTPVLHAVATKENEVIIAEIEIKD